MMMMMVTTRNLNIARNLMYHHISELHCRALIAAGADLTATNHKLQTALHVLCTKRSPFPRLLAALIDKGASLDLRGLNGYRA